MKRYHHAAAGRLVSMIGLVLALLIGFSLQAGAATLVAHGAIDGVVTCEGSPVADVVVAVSGPAPSTDNIWVGVTNISGYYDTDWILPPGDYTVRLYYLGGVCQYADVIVPATVTSGATTTIDFAGARCADILLNGSFETPDVWIVGPTPWPAHYSTSIVRSGIRSMRSGIEPGEDDRVTEGSFYQAITIPADAASATLAFWYRPYTEEAVTSVYAWDDLSWAGYSPEDTIAGVNRAEQLQATENNPNAWYYYDWQEVLVLDEYYRLLEVLQRDLSNEGTAGWAYRSHDLTPYKGRTINIYFNTINNGYGNKRTRMYVDDVSVYSCMQPPACVVTPTNQWVNLYGLDSSYYGAPLTPGQVVEAYDPDGILAGCFVVRSAGHYGAMAVYADDPETPEDEGCESGDVIDLYVEGELAIVLGPDMPEWTENGDLMHVELAVDGAVTRSISLRSGWNLISFDVLPSDTTLTAVLAPIAGKFERVLTSTCAEGGLSYYPSLPPGMNTLTDMDPFHGYWIYMSQAATLQVSGPEIPDSMPLSVCERWNLVSYLPDGPLPVSEALHSIDGDYSTVLAFDGGARSYYTSLPPEMNSLQQMSPTFGYWIRADAAGTLVYPPAGLGMMAMSQPNLDQAPDGLTPTYRWTDAYSLNSRVGGNPLRIGAVIEAFDPDGVKVGQFVVRQAGRFGPMPLYGDDPATPLDEGLEPGDPITFTVDGKRVLTNPARPIWNGELGLLQVDLRTNGGMRE